MQAVKLSPMNKDAFWFLRFWQYAWKHLFDEHKDLVLFEGAVPGFIIGIVAGLFLLQANWMSLFIAAVLIGTYVKARLIQTDILQGEQSGSFTKSRNLWMCVSCAYLGTALVVVLGVIQFILNFTAFLQAIASLPDLLGKLLSLML